jgi:SAM-dependent methyltransferase
MQGGKPSELFRGTAGYYAQYRRPYPQDVVRYMVEAFRLDGHGRLMDAGCGTGQVFSVLAKYFEEVFAFDQDPDMVELARQTAVHAGLQNVTVREIRAEDIGPPLGNFWLAVFAASFHWMDRQRVADLVYDLLEPGGHIAILAPGNPHSGDDPLAKAIQETVREVLGPERRAGAGVYVPGERHGEALAKTRFGMPTTVDLIVREQWTVDQIIGWLYSTSFANKELLGGRVGHFEEMLTQKLLRISGDGVFTRAVDYTVISAAKNF